MLEEFLTKVIVYTPEAMAKGSMWWWILPLAPGVPERLIVTREREFLTWFYEGATADPASISEASIQETLRTFKGNEGVLGALGVYRAAFNTIDQTTPLKKAKVEVPILAIGGEKGVGAKVAEMVSAVAKDVTGETIADCGHFIPEERPAEFVRLGDTYTITISGDDTNGRFCVIDMHIPPGGGPPPHRHDFEETFILLEGEMVATFRGKKSLVRAGDTVNIPSNAPHQFHNASSKPVRTLCICSPAGQENFFQQVGVPVATRTTAPPKMDKEQQQQMTEKTKALAPKYRTELLKEA